MARRTTSTMALGMLVALCGAVAARSAEKPEIVRFAAQETGAVAIEAVLWRPATDRPAPAVIALHGCGGLRDGHGEIGRRERDWAARLTAAGFVVLMPDSFGSRGLGSQCRTPSRTVRASRERVDDVRAAFAWASVQSFVRADAIGLMGWSNGGSTVLSAVAAGRAPAGGDFRTAIAFYPGCRSAAESTRWRPRLDTLILIGEADDWTPAAPCRDLAAAHADRLSLHTYPGAFHDFDAPDMPIRELRGLAFTADGSGVARRGTDPAARADAIARVPEWLSRHLK